MSDEMRYEDVPVDELHEWIERKIDLRIADTLEGLVIGLRSSGHRIEVSSVVVALAAAARHLRSDRDRR